jgi:hypothetical protein
MTALEVLGFGLTAVTLVALADALYTIRSLRRAMRLCKREALLLKSTVERLTEAHDKHEAIIKSFRIAG